MKFYPIQVYTDVFCVEDVGKVFHNCTVICESIV
jgi:hypothetical protein